MDLWPMLTLKRIGGWIHWPNVKIVFKFQLNRRGVDDFRNLTKLVTFGLCWPFDFKNNRLLFMTNSTILWSFMKIGLKMSPAGDWQTDRSTDRQTHATNQYTYEKSSVFTSNKQRDRKIDTSRPYVPFWGRTVHFWGQIYHFSHNYFELCSFI